MTALRPHQQQLLSILREHDAPRYGVVSGPPGSGMRRVLELYIREVASESLVLVLSPRRVLVQQWVDRLRGDSLVPVTDVTAEVALDLLEKPATRRTGVFVATYAATQHGPSSRALSQLDFGIIIHDEPPAELDAAFERLHLRTSRAIAVVNFPHQLRWGPQWTQLWTISIEKLLADGYLTPIGVPFTPASDERDLRDKAISLLSESAAHSEVPFALRSDSLPELHAQLRSLASVQPGRNEFAARAWALLDRIEDSLGDETRLKAVHDAVSGALRTGARCIVLAGTPTDATYIAGHLTDCGTPPSAVITASTSPAERRSLLARLAPGECLIATHVVSESADGWPIGSRVILWPSPSNRWVLGKLLVIAQRTPSLSVVELIQERPEEGEADEQFLTDQLRVLGPDHPDTLSSRNNLARWRGEAGDPAGAVVVLEELLADELRVLGPDHPDTLSSRNNLARWRGEAGDPAGAVVVLEELLADELRVLGPDHPDTLSSRNNLARWRGEAGDPAGAVVVLEELLADELRVLGPDHPDTLSSRNNLARWRGEAGDPAGAVVVLEELLADELRVLGPDHPDTLSSRNNLARWRGEAGDPAGAVVVLEELLADELRVLGPDHPDTLSTRNDLARWKRRLSDDGPAVS
ncbi:tetratricopeptide repeat protein [Saccharopolyspora sp. SCSIO 74807]|uniref:tetratricopeptide repeat protein n=1 Tax=Saccharopolyspora sp. SCSIO 74807 TaxID=3118084 RepID=UPI0030CF5AC8